MNILAHLTLGHYLALGAVLFCISLAGIFLNRKNVIMLLMSLELMLLSVNINFVIFNRYLYPDQLQGHFFAIFVVGIAAAEASVAIALIINIYRKLKNIDVENVNELRY